MAKLLIVDDHQDLLDVLQDFFEVRDHHVIACNDGNDAMEILHENNIDLLITDIIMPEKEGLELIREVKESWPNLPIVAMSGGNTDGSFSYLKIAEVFGARETFNKPLNLMQFVEAVEEILKDSVFIG